MDKANILKTFLKFGRRSELQKTKASWQKWNWKNQVYSIS